MRFSVLISIYNKENPQYFKTALDSIINQRLQPNEVVIVKDGPLTKELERVIEDFKKVYNRVKVIGLDMNIGLGRALAIGVEACSYEWIARMDSDDISLPDRFYKQIQYLKKHPECVLLGTWVEEFADDNQYKRTTKLPTSNDKIISFSKKRNPFRHMTVIFRKDIVLALENYRHFLWFEDYDLWVRIINAGYIVANMPDVLVRVRANSELFQRRGGLKYFKQDLEFQKFLLNLKHITYKEFFFNIIVRGMIRFIPNKMRELFYKLFLWG